jgi:diphthine-ammonia ligase
MPNLYPRPGAEHLLPAIPARCAVPKLRVRATTLTEDGECTRSHGLRRAFLEAQASAIGAPIIFRSTSWAGYEVAFVDAVREAVAQGAHHGVFGDLDFTGNRIWEEAVCRQGGASCHLPLWQWDRNDYMKSLVGNGFVPVVVAVKDGLLTPDWLGQKVDVEAVSHGFAGHRFGR